MKGFQTKLDVIGNNIANVNTIGYKKSTINFQDLLSQNLSGSGVNPMQVGLGVQLGAVNVIHTPGSAMTTGVGTDLTIMGDGFFVVKEPDNTPPGGERSFLTRAGNFVVDSTGTLVTSQGYNVLSSTGNKITISPTAYDSFNITRDGQVWVTPTGGGNEVKLADGLIGISNPPNPAGLRKYGGSMYEVTAASGGTSNLAVAGARPYTVEGANSMISAGMLEMSNVDLTEEFTEMIVAQRGFQANSRTITTSDEILQEVVNLKR